MSFAWLVIGFFLGVLVMALANASRSTEIFPENWKAYQPRLRKGEKPPIATPPRGGSGAVPAKKKAAPRRRYQRPRET